MKFKHILKSNPLSVIIFAAVVFAIVMLIRLNTKIGLIFLLGFSVIFALWILWNIGSYNKTVKAIRSVNKALLTDDKNNGLNNMPFPVIVADENGEIRWMNDSFAVISKKFRDFAGYNVNEIIEGKYATVSSVYSGAVEVSSLDEQFSVFSFTVDNGLYVYYFCDNTYYKNIKNKYDEAMPALLLVSIDSLEDTEENLTHIDYTSAVANVERTVSNWLASNSCTFRKYSEGKFFALTEQKHFHEMTQDRFSVLNEVRRMNEENDSGEITLTIGIGKSDNFINCENLAREALELAKGRGGDQVAVNDNGKYTFYGGKSSMKERKGKVTIKLLCNEFDDIIKSSDSIYITGHTYSDFDSLGSAVGLAQLCRNAGKYVRIVCNTKTTLAAQMLEYIRSNDIGIKFIEPEDISYEHFLNATAIICDTHRPDLLDGKELLSTCDRTIVIDHHRLIPDKVIEADLLIHDANASSACEMVTELSEYSEYGKKQMKEITATSLLAGIMLDTKNFTVRAGGRTFEAAAYLKDSKASTVTARRMFAGSKEENMEINKAISDAEFYDDFAVIIYTGKSEITTVVAAKSADALLDIKNVLSSYTIYYSGSGVKISARSLGNVNVQLIMEKLGGGGHAIMAAAQLNGKTPEEAKQLLLNAIDEYKKDNNTEDKK